MSDEQEKIYIDEITERLAERSGEEPETAKEFIHTLFETIGEELMEGDRVPVYQFGVFKKSYVEEREGRDPNTGEEITIPAHYRINFTPSERLADAVNEKYSHLESYDIPEGIPDGPGRDEFAAAAGGGAETEKPPDAGELPEEEHPVHVPVIEAEEEHLEPVKNDEMSALIGPEKESPRPEKRRGLLAVLTAAVIALLLGAFMLGRYSVRRDVEEIVIVEPGETADSPAAEEAETEAADTVTETVEQQKKRELIQQHTVVPGNTFVSLAEQYWGDKYLWPVMYLDNRERFPNPNYLKPGQNVEIYASPAGKEYVLDAYLDMYSVYRELGEDLIRRGKRSNSPSLQNIGYRRLMEARTVIFTATRYDPDFHETVRDRLKGEDYTMLKRYIDYHGPFED